MCWITAAAGQTRAAAAAATVKLFAYSDEYHPCRIDKQAWQVGLWDVEEGEASNISGFIWAKEGGRLDGGSGTVLAGISIIPDRVIVWF